MQIIQQTYIEFLNTINPEVEHSSKMMENTSKNRRFFSVKTRQGWFHGLRSKKDAEYVYYQLN